MIIKKPYAFIARFYKIINLLLLIPTVYLLFQMTEIATFFNEYVLTNYSTTQKHLTETYIPALTLIAPIITVVIHTFIWVILKLKKKNNSYHIISAGYHLLLFIALVLFYTSMINIEMSNLESTFARFLQDSSELCVLPLYGLLVAGAINVIGLNVKTLRFDKHQELRVTEEDEEEIEVKVSNDNYDAKRRLVHTLRELKYYVAENKLIIGIIIVAIIFMIGFKAFLNYQVYNQSLNNNQTFSFDNFELSVKDSYITKTDFRGRIIADKKYYLAVKIGIHNKGSETKIAKSVFKIRIGETSIVPSYEKSNRFVDIGAAYQGQTIFADEAEDYVFIYELTESQLANNYEMRILKDLRLKESKLVASYTKINIEPKYLTEVEINSGYKLEDVINLKSTTLQNTNYTLKDLKIVSHYNYTYEVCETPKKCSTYQDTIVPTGGKLLMIVEDELKYDESSPYFAYQEKNFYQDFITLEYTFDIASGKDSGATTKIGNVVEITPKTLKDVKIYEIPSNVMNAYKLNVLLSVRNQVFIIKAK